MMNLIAAERRELAGMLSRLSPDQWRGPSLCVGWTVAHVVAHLTMPFRISEQQFVAALQRAGGHFNTVSDEIASRDSQVPQAELVAALRENVDNPWSPPGGGLPGALSHDIIHGLDVAWPIGIKYPIPGAAITSALDLITSPKSHSLFGFPLDDIELSATDLNWSTGDGALLAGRSRDLLLLLAGRQVPPELFDGSGAQRLPAALTVPEHKRP
jgi:uncharacterized Actinobacterial protein TIGR03083